MKLSQVQVQHFFLRSGFGQPFDLIEGYIGQNPNKLFQDQVVLSQDCATVEIEIVPQMTMVPGQMSADMRKEMAQQRKQEIQDLNVQWIRQMVSSDAQLREKMAFFWHDDFACRARRSDIAQGYLNVIREHALENFGDLLRAVSKTPAMLNFLNNQQNRKESPNENFAREVMELFTLGRDQGYTEKDVVEAARAFTGWAFNKEGKFVFRKKFHDNGIKTIFGKSGNFDGDDVINMLLEKKQTADYISQKWVRFFMNYGGHEKLEKRMADVLYSTNYDIKSGLEVLFTSSEFYSEENIATRIKSPIELIVGMQRQLYVTITHDQSLLYLQRTLGQVLFNPPNVSGWSDGYDWVDSATLMFRMNLPQLIFKSALIQNYPESFDDNDTFKLRGPLKTLKANIDLEAMNNKLSQLSNEQVRTFILQTSTKEHYDTTNLIDQIIYLMSKPEYQLC
jgi:uncharacterized protein (DUF1800 family)